MIILLSLDTLLIDSLWKTAKKWRAGYDVEMVDSAREGILSFGERGMYYIITKYLWKKDRLGTRAIRDMCLRKPEYCSSGLKEILKSKDTIALKNALYVASEVQVPGLEKILIKVLKRQKKGVWISRVMRAIQKSGGSEVCPILPKYFNHNYTYVRMRVALLVGERCKSYKKRLWAMLKDSVFVVRDAALRSLVSLGFSKEEFKKATTFVPLTELFKLLYLKCPSEDYLKILKSKSDSTLYNFWKNHINCD